jgi:CDP-paratose 2-epimerase
MLEAILACERLVGRPMNWKYAEQNRTGDHIWWISDVRRFQADYPQWSYRYGIDEILIEIIDTVKSKQKLAGN